VSDTPNVDKEVEQPPSTQVDTPQVGISTEQSEPPKPTAEEKPETSADTITAVVPNSAENSDAENTAKVATRKLLIPTVFDPSRQQEAEEEAKKKREQEREKIIQEARQREFRQHRQQVPEQGDGATQKPAISEVEALLENDDFDSLEKLYEDYWG